MTNGSPSILFRSGNPTRRHSARGTPQGEPPRRALVAIIETVYQEMPGLMLQLDEAARVFGLRPATCAVILNDLVKCGSLNRDGNGQYRCQLERDNHAEMVL
jgi:hypothetical protein